MQTITTIGLGIGILQARQLLIEFIGGEPGEELRDQFA